MFSYHVLVVQTVLVGADLWAFFCSTFYQSSQPSENGSTIYHCLNTSCVGLHEDTGTGAAILSDAKYLSVAMLGRKELFKPNIS